MAATPPRPCCSSWACPNGPSCRSWPGRAPPWPRATSTSRPGPARLELRLRSDGADEHRPGPSGHGRRSRRSGLRQMAEDRGFEPLRAVNPTRFPSERHRPLGESSAEEATGRRRARRNHRVEWPRERSSARWGTRPGRLVGREPLTYTRPQPPMWRHHAELPQGRKAARVGTLCRVRGGPFHARKISPVDRGNLDMSGLGRHDKCREPTPSTTPRVVVGVAG